jgi:hypothetical protein
MITKMSKVRLRGEKVTDRSKVVAPGSIGDISRDKNNNLTKSMESLVNNKLSEIAGMMNMDKNERSVLA